MASTSSLQKRLEEEQEDDVEVDGLDEVVKILEPYLSDKSKVQSLKDMLVKLGASNLSHIELLQESDFTELIPPIKFRQMQKDRKEKNKENNAVRHKPGLAQGYVWKLEDILTPAVWTLVEADEEMLFSTDRKTLIQDVGRIIANSITVIREHEVLQKCTSIVRAHPTSLGCLKNDEEDIQEAAWSLCDSVLYHVRYLQQLRRNKRRMVLGETADNGQKRKKKDNFSKAQNFGLDPDRDLPKSLPDNETVQTQESKRVCLVGMNDTVPRGNDVAVIMKNMEETYVSIRIDVNKKLQIEKLLERWPYIGMYPVLESHYETLMNVKLADLISQFDLRYESMERFFEAESHQQRKGKSDVHSKLKKAITSFRNLGQNATNNHRFILMVQCASILMKVKEDALFMHFEDTTTFDEIQSYAKFPKDGKPIVAVLGPNLYAQNVRAYVVIENRCLSENTTTVFKAIITAFMSYFVFKIAYPKRAAPLLYFLQSKVFRIKGDGSKQQREMNDEGKYLSNPPKKPEKYLTFMHKYKEYCSMWRVMANNSEST